jgi:hypothetical protein
MRVMKAKHSFASSALALAALALLAAAASTRVLGTYAAFDNDDSVIAAALGELPAKLRSDVTDLMLSMKMDATNIHFQRLVSRADGKVVKDAMAFIK